MRAIPLVLVLLLPLLPVAAAASVADDGCTHAADLVHACTSQNGNGDPCAEVWLSRQPPIVDACIPLSALVGEVCLVRICVYQGEDGLCVGGQIGHPTFEECVGSVQLAASAADAACTHLDPSVHVCLWRNDNGAPCADLVVEGEPILDDDCVKVPPKPATSTSYPCVYATGDVWVCYERGCVVGMYGHYPVGYCLPPITVETAEPCLPGDLACVEREGRRVCVVYRTGDLEDPRRACVG